VLRGGEENPHETLKRKGGFLNSRTSGGRKGRKPKSKKESRDTSSGKTLKRTQRGKKPFEIAGTPPKIRRQKGRGKLVRSKTLKKKGERKILRKKGMHRQRLKKRKRKKSTSPKRNGVFTEEDVRAFGEKRGLLS